MQETHADLLAQELEKYLSYQVLDGRPQAQIQAEITDAHAALQADPTDLGLSRRGPFEGL